MFKFYFQTFFEEACKAGPYSYNGNKCFSVIWIESEKPRYPLVMQGNEWTPNPSPLILPSIYFLSVEAFYL